MSCHPSTSSGLDTYESASRRLESLSGQTSPKATRSLPVSVAEMQERGWDAVDVVFVTGDAYVDHPSFAMAVLGRVLEAGGYRVGLVSQPDWHSCEDWRRFGRPRLFFAISAGNMDSMLNHYTANRKVRNSDAYSPGGRIGTRPDRATLAYCQRAREAYRGVPVIAGGVEASLRRLAHYDYWSDKVRRSILMDCKADLVVFGMGEAAIVEIADRLAAGETVRDLRNMRGVAYALGASEQPPDDVLVVPSFEQVSADKNAFAEATRLTHKETNPFNARRLVQWHGRQAVVCNPPAFPISCAAMDAIYGLPYTRRAHPSYDEPIPAHEMIKDSVTVMRGCFGGCSFCSITAHQGRIVQSRSQRSILDELGCMAQDSQFKGVVSDLGGPTANMYEMRCTRPDIESLCRRESCVYPKICEWLNTDHDPLIELMRKARNVPGIKKVLVASGIRMDLALQSPAYVRELVREHVGGHLKVAPEHVSSRVLHLMHKPDIKGFLQFARRFQKESERAGKEQYLVPYFIASHPGSDLDAMIELALFLKQHGYRPDQVQDFIPAPCDVATAMYYTGIDPFTKEVLPVARNSSDRKLQRALMQFFKPENYFEVRNALERAGRQDLIGHGSNCLIPPTPPREATIRQRKKPKERPRTGTTADVPKKKKGRKRESRNAPGSGYRPNGKKHR